MSFNRLGFVLAAATYFALLPDASWAMWKICIAYSVLTVGLFAHILLRPARNLFRRGFAMVLDVTIISLELWAGEQQTAVLFPLYLWLVLGNGFRFGVPWLRAAMVLSVLEFTTVILATPFWRDQPYLSVGLLLGLIVVPLYAGTLVRKLSRATRQAEEASRAKSLFLASVSHELRTPLTAIIGMGALLRETRLDGEQRDMVETVDRASRSLLSLIESILDFSRIEAGRMPPRTAEIDPLVLLADVRRLLGPQAREKGVRLSAHTTLRLPPRLLGDAQQLTDVMLNLVGNAIKFTQQGGVAMALDAEPLGASRVRLRCEVSDTGIGIAPEAQERIFDSFSQADEGIFHRFGGTGLGLAICRRLVLLSGGDIGVRSTPGAGSTFWFTLDLPLAEGERPSPPPQDILLLAAPGERAKRVAALLGALGHHVELAGSLGEAQALQAAPASAGIVAVLPEGLEDTPKALASALRAAASQREPLLALCQGRARGLPENVLRHEFALVVPEDAAAPEWSAALALLASDVPPRREASATPLAPATRPLSVLIADDNQINRRVFNAILERAGHHTRLAANGEEALEALEREAFDLVLMDVNMPVMDGLEAVKLYRFSTMGERRVPIIALTADATPETRQLCAEAGMDAYLTKPIEPLKLLASVEALANGTSSPDAIGAGAAGGRHQHDRLPPAGPPLDEATLAGLEALGGTQFLAELARDFLEDAEEHLIHLDIAISEQDVLAFRATVHAIRSGAANLGAQALFELCSFIEHLPASDLPRQGRAYLTHISGEIDRAREALARRSGPIGRPPRD
jgi:two-component system sensor histidine kinase RpfC